MTEMTPTEIVDEFIRELARVYGRERADLSRVFYNHGWFYIQVARKTPSGDYGVWGVPRARRKGEVLEMLARLQTKEE